MKILEEKKMEPLETACNVCGSKLELNPEDFYQEGYSGTSADFICPVCGCRNEVHYMYIPDAQFKFRIHQLDCIRRKKEQLANIEQEKVVARQPRRPGLFGIRLGSRKTLTAYINDEGVVMQMTKESGADF